MIIGGASVTRPDIEDGCRSVLSRLPKVTASQRTSLPLTERRKVRYTE